MPTIPTGSLERELRKLFLKFVQGLAFDSSNLQDKTAAFQRAAIELIEGMGGQVAMLGALGDFPAPRSLDLSPWAGTFYEEAQQAAIKASIVAGLNSREAAKAMFNAGLGKSYRKLERLARTETTNAYWKNAFGSVADLPALVMLWGSEDGPRTCQWCKERDGLVMDSPNLRDHPNGRCTPIPTLRSQVNYRGSISPDNQIYHNPDWNKPSSVVQPAPVVESAKPLTDDSFLAGGMPAQSGNMATMPEKKPKRQSVVYVAVAPDGTTFTRSSVREFRYANLYIDPDNGKWTVSQFTSSLASAESVASRLTDKRIKNVLVPTTTSP